MRNNTTSTPSPIRIRTSGSTIERPSPAVAVVSVAVTGVSVAEVSVTAVKGSVVNAGSGNGSVVVVPPVSSVGRGATLPGAVTGAPSTTATGDAAGGAAAGAGATAFAADVERGAVVEAVLDCMEVLRADAGASSLLAEVLRGVAREGAGGFRAVVLRAVPDVDRGVDRDVDRTVSRGFAGYDCTPADDACETS